MKREFTLLELLIVIVILGILLSLLMPSLRRSKDLAQTISCSGKQKQIGTYLIMGISDYSGRFVPALPSASENWVYLMEGEIRGKTINGWVFKKDNSDADRIWYCPSYDAKYYGYAGWVHYGYNNTSLVGGGGSKGRGYKPGAFLSAVDEPTEVLLIGDSVHWAGDRGIWEFHVNSGYKFRHNMGTRMNFMFVDGHLENISESDIGGWAGLRGLLNGTWR